MQRHVMAVLHYILFLANKIQISKTTWLLLSMKGGFVMEERGMVEVKVIFYINIMFLVYFIVNVTNKTLCKVQ